MSQTILAQSTAKLVGARVKSVSAPRVLRGRTTYVDDIKRPGMLYLSFARSTVAHADIRAVEVQSAKAESSVVYAISGKEIQGKIAPFPVFSTPRGTKSYDELPMATNKVRYVGEIVAGVLSASRSLAEDNAELVTIDYRLREPVLDPERALEENSSLVIDAWNSNEAYSTHLNEGDVEEAFRRADHISKARYSIQRQYGASMEPRGVLADYDNAGDSLTLYTATQWPHIVRTVASRMLGISEHKIRVIAPDVGGGFGNKQDVYPEEIIASYLSMKTGRPVKWTASRSEDMLSTVHARDQIHYIELASSRDGTLLGVRDRIISDIGAFHIMSIGPQLVTLGTLPGAYKISNWDIELHCAVTNKTPVGAYRGFGASESNFVIERSIDSVARQLKLDRARLRLKNFISANEFPYENALGSVYDSGDYAKCLNKGLELSGYEEFKIRKERSKKNGKLLGLGLSFVVEATGIGSSREMARDGFRIYSGYDSATIRVSRSGGTTVLTGLSPHGQGLETSLAQVCADELGIPLSSVTIEWGDTDSAPYGFGTWGSRSAVIGSAVVKMSADKVKEKMRKIAAHILQTSNEIQYRHGRFVSSSGKNVTFREVAEQAYSASNLPPGMEPGLEETSFFDPQRPEYSYAVHMPIVEVNPESGVVKLLSYFVVHDCGTVINPTIVEGQLHGGVAQGIAGALLEQLKYNESGQFVSASFLDYLLPTSRDVPDIISEYTETPSDVNPLGIKGTGEGGAIAPPAAIASAIEDALSDYSVNITDTPITPESITKLLANSPLGHRN
jgi:aerobic carbon-monoxide dehydrogenase large subunit